MRQTLFLLFILPSLIIHGQTTVVTQNPNLNFITSTNATIYDIPIDYGGKIKIGKGLNYENPEDPIPMHNDLLIIPTTTKIIPDAFYLTNAKIKTATFKINTPINYNVAEKQEEQNFYEFESDQELAYTLTASFGAGFGFGSIDLSYKHVRNARQNGKILIFTAKSTKAGSEDISNLSLNPAYAKEVSDINSLADKNMRIDKFINKFGTHYISSITYGYRLAIYAEMNSSNQSELTEFSAKFRLFTASGSVDEKTSAFFKAKSVTIKASITSGESTPSIFLTNFQDIYDFFQALKSGTKTINPAPLRMKIANMRTRFLTNQYKNIYSDLSPQYGQAYNSPYGVPKGTIIPWYVPNATVLSKDKNTILSKLVPEGWLICDGTNGTPDLKDKFLIGTNDLSKVGTPTGSKDHEHTVSGKAEGMTDAGKSGCASCGETEGENKRAHGHSINGKTNREDNIPPSLYIVYIIKN